MESIFDSINLGFGDPGYVVVFEYKTMIWPGGFYLEEKPAKILWELVSCG